MTAHPKVMMYMSTIQRAFKARAIAAHRSTVGLLGHFVDAAGAMLCLEHPRWLSGPGFRPLKQPVLCASLGVIYICGYGTLALDF